MMNQTVRSIDEHQEYPTGWLALVRHESVARIIDAMLNMPPHREMTQTELADLAGVSRQSVYTHLEFLLEIEILEPVPDTSPQRYRFDPGSDVGQAVVELDGAVNAAGPFGDGE